MGTLLDTTAFIELERGMRSLPAARCRKFSDDVCHCRGWQVDARPEMTRRTAVADLEFAAYPDGPGTSGDDFPCG
jgi:hypothetical protein